MYRKVRLEALRESPEAFATTYESALGRTPESWAAQADGSASGPDRATFIVLEGEAVAGLAALYRDEKIAEEGELIQVWVAPGLRGHGTAEKLMDGVLEWAGENGFARVKAEVTGANGRALRFYERYGFARAEAEVGRVVLIKCVG
ncbi:MAG: GNAT family N-acetyltransferase [Luteolibacter sp.]